MIVIDVESTGMDPRLCSLLSVGALDFDNPTNQFYLECYAFPGAHIEKEALEVCGFTREEITTPTLEDSGTPFIKGDTTPSQISPLERGRGKSTDKEVVEAFLAWMPTCKEWTLAGQNPSFDRDFLEETAHRYHIDWPLAHRTIDLHSVAYYHLVRAGKEVPLKNNHSSLNLDRILEHVGLPSRKEKHNALTDTKLEAEAFARLFKGESLLTEYSHFPVPAALKV